MPIIDLANFTRTEKVPDGSVFILGYFDGVHLGHRALITEAKRIAAELGGRKTCVWTFDALPRVSDKSLTTTEEKCNLFADCGVDYVVLADFDSLKGTEGETFLNHNIADEFSPSAVVCGFNFTFGKGASCTAYDLATLAQKRAIPCSIVSEQKNGGERVSSSRIRSLIESGEMSLANSLLGSPYTLTSTIEHGVQIGRKMGVRTINQRLPLGKVCPKRGVYCCTVTFDEVGKTVTYGGVCNIGSRPTVNANTDDVTVETHVFDFDGEVYGKCVTTRLYAMLREEKKFSDIDSLKEAIRKDAERARDILKNILK